MSFWPDSWPSLDDIAIPVNPEQWLKDRVIEILNYLGYEWPKTSEGTLDAWAATWGSYAATANTQIDELERSVATIGERNAGDIPDAVVAYLHSDNSNLHSLRSMASAAPIIQNVYGLTAGLIRTLRVVVIGKILIDAISLAAAIITGGASAAVSILMRTGASIGINMIIDQTINELLGGGT